MFAPVLQRLGIDEHNSGVFAGQWLRGADRAEIESFNPATGEVLACATTASADDYDRAVVAAQQAFQTWRTVPAPLRGEFIRRFGQALRDQKDDLGLLVTLETGKILSEGRGEVQEM